MRWTPKLIEVGVGKLKLSEKRTTGNTRSRQERKTRADAAVEEKDCFAYDS